MKNLLILLILSFGFFGCYKLMDKSEPQVQVEPQVEQVQPEQVQPKVPYSTSWIRGYNDGYNGNWVGPINWVGSNEYRAGWTVGNKDTKAGKPHRLNP